MDSGTAATVWISNEMSNCRGQACGCTAIRISVAGQAQLLSACDPIMVKSTSLNQNLSGMARPAANGPLSRPCRTCITDLLHDAELPATMPFARAQLTIEEVSDRGRDRS